MVAVDERLDPLVRAAAAATPDEHDELQRVAASLFEPAPADAREVPRFGRYRPVRVIGAGGLGEVLLAHDPELDRKVAIKSIARRLDPAARQRLQARMRREAQALARLRHPNVVAVYDVGVADDGVFLAMEYVDGATLSQWLAAAPHTVDEIVGVVVEAGRGLAAAHAAGVIHRDVKPSNILVDREGRARVVDFRLAFADADPAPSRARCRRRAS
ncbi:MAG: serine/threonine-protein kinase [Nannocystaceae bacterium]